MATPPTKENAREEKNGFRVLGGDETLTVLVTYVRSLGEGAELQTKIWEPLVLVVAAMAVK